MLHASNIIRRIFDEIFYALCRHRGSLESSTLEMMQKMEKY